MTHYETTCPRCGNKGDVCLDMDIGGMWQVGCNLCGHPVRLKEKPKPQWTVERDGRNYRIQAPKGERVGCATSGMVGGNCDRIDLVPQAAQALCDFISEERG